MDAPVIVVLIAAVDAAVIDGLNAVLNRAVYAVLIGALTGVLIRCLRGVLMFAMDWICDEGGLHLAGHDCDCPPEEFDEEV